MKKATRFLFLQPIVDRVESRIELPYAIEFEDGTRDEYREMLTLPPHTIESWELLPPTLLKALTQSLHLAVGVRYWSMYCPSQIELTGARLSSKQADFWNTFYTKGLGEFFYRNQIDFRGLVSFPFDRSAKNIATPYPRSARSLVPHGGGKDSVVSTELLTQGGLPFGMFSFGSSRMQKQMALLGKKELHSIGIEVDPKLLSSASDGRTYSGHIPYTGITMFAALLVAALEDYRWIVFSNERSADSGNTTYLGEGVNHQWAKSAEFEQLSRQYIADYITPDIVPFSLLRPLTEIEIVRRFSAFPEYFRIFSSCNWAYTYGSERSGSGDSGYWCGVCPKCAFVFAGLSAFVSRETLLAIFKKNLFDDTRLIWTFAGLLGIEGFYKPFECVGTKEEMVVAMYRAHKSGSYDDTPAMRLFEDRVLPHIADIAALENQVFSSEKTGPIPIEFANVLQTQKGSTQSK